MSQPVGRKVKEFLVVINQYYQNGTAFVYPTFVTTKNGLDQSVNVTAGYTIAKETHSINDALDEIRKLLNLGHSLSKIQLVRRVVINSEFNLSV
jgi:hypothetical protein